LFSCLNHIHAKALERCSAENAMSDPLVVTIPHSLGKEKAVERLKSGMASMLSAVPLVKFDEPTWIGDQMSFKVQALGQVASGTVDVGDDSIRLAVTLPLLLRQFASRVVGAVTQGTKRLLEKK
jgi:hypothetical protein